MPTMIDLDNIREACPVYLGDDVMHKNVYHKLARSISEIYSRIDPSEAGENESVFRTRRTHDVIGIFGRRGTGKTTVLISVLEDIRKGNSASALHNIWQKKLQGAKHVTADSIVPLPVVDPTMMGSKEHMLLRVVNLIRVCVEKGVAEPSSREGFANWGATLRRLVQAIVNLEVAGEARQELFYDEFAASEKMHVIVHVEDLETNFKEFIRSSLQLLGKKAFVLGIDDMDTNPGSAWASLECIRKYFTSPQLIVMLAGDLDMFTEIIRSEQRKFFDFRPSEALGSFDSRPQMHVETLVEQYLLKLIPMMHRVQLHTFLLSTREELGQYDIYYRVDIMRFGRLHSLLELMHRFNMDWGLHLSIFMQAYDNILLDTPLRTAREIFNCLVESNTQPRQDDEHTATQRRAEMVRGLARIFTNSLYQFGYADAAQELQSLETPQGIVDLLDKLVLHKLLQANSDDLYPRQHAQWLNVSMVVVQGALSHAIRNAPGVAFHYLFKISVFKEFVQRQNLLTAAGAEYHVLRDNLHFADGMDLNNTCKYLAGLAPCQVDTKGYAHGLGTVLLDVPDRYTAFPAWGTLYPLLGIYQRQTLAGTQSAFSIWSFLGLMGDTLLATNDMLLEEVVRALPYPKTIASQSLSKENVLLRAQASSSEHIYEPDQNPQDISKRAIGLKAKLAQWRDDVRQRVGGNPHPKTIASQSLSKEDVLLRAQASSPEHIYEPDQNPQDISKRAIGVKAILAQWRDDVRQWVGNPQSNAVAAGLFPRIAQRYVSALDSLDQHMKDLNSHNFADFYSKNCALLFLQAVLVEESRLVTNTSPLRYLSLADPIDFEENFIYNCTMVREFVSLGDTMFTMMPMFSLCCSYPLWPLLLGHHLTNNMLHSLGLLERSENILLKGMASDPRIVRAVQDVLRELHNTQDNIFAHSPDTSPNENSTEERWFHKFNLQAACFVSETSIGK